MSGEDYVPFQFLLGRLETDLSQDLSVDEQAFQFLLGRLETVMFHCRRSKHIRVSIPLR